MLKCSWFRLCPRIPSLSCPPHPRTRRIHTFMPVCVDYPASCVSPFLLRAFALTCVSICGFQSYLPGPPWLLCLCLCLCFCLCLSAQLRGDVSFWRLLGDASPLAPRYHFDTRLSALCAHTLTPHMHTAARANTQPNPNVHVHVLCVCVCVCVCVCAAPVVGQPSRRTLSRSAGWQALSTPSGS